MLTATPAYLTVEQVADRIGVSRETVYRLIWNKQLPATQLAGPGSSWRISERKLTEWLDQPFSSDGDGAA
jgi:excisionase family DNA binding protein